MNCNHILAVFDYERAINFLYFRNDVEFATSRMYFNYCPKCGMKLITQPHAEKTSVDGFSNCC